MAGVHPGGPIAHPQFVRGHGDAGLGQSGDRAQAGERQAQGRGTVRGEAPQQGEVREQRRIEVPAQRHQRVSGLRVGAVDRDEGAGVGRDLAAQVAEQIAIPMDQHQIGRRQFTGVRHRLQFHPQGRLMALQMTERRFDQVAQLLRREVVASGTGLRAELVREVLRQHLEPRFEP